MRERSFFISPRAALIASALVAASAVFLASMPLASVNLGTMILFIYPFILLLIAGLAGFAPAFGAVAILALGMYISSRSLAASALSALYLLPPLAAWMACVLLKKPFWHTVGIMLVAYIAVVLAIYIMLQAQSGGNMAAWGAEAAINGLQTLPERDVLLYLFSRSGFLQLNTDTVGQVFIENGQAWFFTQEALTELYNQVRTRVDLWLRGVVPTLISSMSINLNVAGTAVALYYARRHAQRVSFKNNDDQLTHLFEHMLPPAFSQWYVPKKYGSLLWILGGFYLLSRLSRNPTLFLAGGMMYNVFAAVYVLQGLSLVNSFQKARGAQPRTRGLTIVLLFMIASPFAMMLGIFDQLRDPRKLRKQTNTDADSPLDRRM